MAHTALIVEDETSLARNIKEYLEVDGYETRVCGDGETALRMLESFRPDVVVLDLRLPGMDGLTCLQELRQRARNVRVIMLTAHGSVATAVEAIKAGAHEFLVKPVVLSELRRVVDQALQQPGREVRAVLEARPADGGLAALIGESMAMVALKQRIGQLLQAEAAMQAPPPAVLIGGETGTGKELIARALHFDGPRRVGPFIELNCGALPLSLIEGELFGHERGAFTDARQKRVGLIEAASGGTLFLDEIGELEPALQVKLLRVLENRTVRRLGAAREQPVDIRVVAATNRTLRRLVDEGSFRADLYYRLSIIELTAPPLRQRGDDVLVLARHFLDQLAHRYVRPAPQAGRQRCGEAPRPRLAGQRARTAQSPGARHRLPSRGRPGGIGPAAAGRRDRVRREPAVPAPGGRDGPRRARAQSHHAGARSHRLEPDPCRAAARAVA